jgi:hypothetical protein
MQLRLNLGHWIINYETQLTLNLGHWKCNNDFKKPAKILCLYEKALSSVRSSTAKRNTTLLKDGFAIQHL